MANKTPLSKQLINAIATEVMPVAPPRPAALKARVMARIQGKKAFDILTVKADQGQWLTIMPGVQKKILSEDRNNNVQTYLLKLAPGASIPEHQHLGDEECIILEGEVYFGDLKLSAGDYLFAPKGSIHKQATTQTGGIAFLRAYEAYD